jgi:hypothetical protein
MAKPPIPVGYAKCEMLGTYGPTTWANILYFQVEGTGTPIPTDAFTVLESAMHDLYANVFAPAMHSPEWTTTTQKIGYRDSSSSMSRITIADAIAGAATSSDPEAAQVALLINWATGDPRKGGKARTYVPGIEKGQLQDTARLTTSMISNTNTALATWFASLPTRSHGTATGLVLVEMSFVNAKADRANAVAFPVIIGSVNPIVATQRRRVDRLRG